MKYIFRVIELTCPFEHYLRMNTLVKFLQDFRFWVDILSTDEIQELLTNPIDFDKHWNFDSRHLSIRKRIARKIWKASRTLSETSTKGWSANVAPWKFYISSDSSIPLKIMPFRCVSKIWNCSDKRFWMFEPDTPEDSLNMLKELTGGDMIHTRSLKETSKKLEASTNVVSAGLGYNNNCTKHVAETNLREVWDWTPETKEFLYNTPTPGLYLDPLSFVYLL